MEVCFTLEHVATYIYLAMYVASYVTKHIANYISYIAICLATYNIASYQPNTYVYN